MPFAFVAGFITGVSIYCILKEDNDVRYFDR